MICRNGPPDLNPRGFLLLDSDCACQGLSITSTMLEHKDAYGVKLRVKPLDSSGKPKSIVRVNLEHLE